MHWAVYVLITQTKNCNDRCGAGDGGIAGASTETVEGADGAASWHDCRPKGLFQCCLFSSHLPAEPMSKRFHIPHENRLFQIFPCQSNNICVQFGLVWSISFWIESLISFFIIIYAKCNNSVTIAHCFNLIFTKSYGGAYFHNTWICKIFNSQLFFTVNSLTIIKTLYSIATVSRTR